MTVERFVPTENELFEYAINHGVPFKDYRTWLYGQLRDVLKLAFELDVNLIPLSPYSKAPNKRFPFEPLTYEQALEFLHESETQLRFGWRGVAKDSKTLRFALLDYDKRELTPELEYLVAKKKVLAIMTPNGWSFPTLEPVVPELWCEMEKIDGFAPSQSMIDARIKRAIEYEKNHANLLRAGFTQEELDVLVKPKDLTVSNARRNRSFICLAGSVTCSSQTKATGLETPVDPETGKSVQHFGFGHTEPNQLCNGSPAGKHDYRMRLFHNPDSYTSFVPRSFRVLPFKNFAEIVLGLKKRRALPELAMHRITEL